MIKLHFESPEEFENLFETNNKKTNDQILDSIRKAMNDNKKIANLWSITFSAHPHAYSVSLPSEHWANVLEQILEFYTEEGYSDEAIDCWEILECAKVW